MHFMKNYYTLIEYTPTQVRFYDRLGRENQCSMQQLLVRGLLEFFQPQDAQRLLDKAHLSQQGTLLSRLDSGQLWVPYRRYAYFPFFAFIAIAAQVMAPFMSIQRIIIYDQIFFGSFLLLPFAFVATDLVNELYGYQTTKRMIRQSAVIMILISGSIACMKNFFVNSVCEYNHSWVFINELIPKVLVFYAISLLTADTLNAWLFQRIRFWLTNRAFWVRSIISTTVSRVTYSAVTVSLLFITGTGESYRSFNTKFFKIVFASVEFSVMYITILMLPMYFICYWIKRQDFKSLPEGQIQPNLC